MMCIMFVLEGIDHVALTVQDLDRSVFWYSRILGLKRRHEEVWGDDPAVLYAGTTAVALFQAGPDFVPANSAAMRHLAFRVDRLNFEQAQREMAAEKIAYTFEDHGIAQSIYFQDPDGYQLEITTYQVPEAA